MCGDTKELMMAIVIATTALIGMTAVVFGQVAQSNKLKSSEKRRLFKHLSRSISLGVVALLSSIFWFIIPIDTRLVVIFPSLLLIAELVLLLAPALLIWYRSTDEESPSKPTTQTERPRKRAPAR
jgi:hypothetical protein